MGYFKPIHTVIFEFLRGIGQTSIDEICDLTINNILLSSFSVSEETKKANAAKTIKQILFTLPMGLMNGPPVVSPFLPKQNKPGYTLVLDLDETLVHFFYTPSGGTFLVRPHAMQFLKSLSQLYEIVIFTAAMKDVRKSY